MSQVAGEWTIVKNSPCVIVPVRTYAFELAFILLYVRDTPFTYSFLHSDNSTRWVTHRIRPLLPKGICAFAQIPPRMQKDVWAFVQMSLRMLFGWI